MNNKEIRVSVEIKFVLLFLLLVLLLEGNPSVVDLVLDHVKQELKIANGNCR